MRINPTVAVIEGTNSQLTANMFMAKGCTLTNSLDKADLICFTGGADLDPAMYGESKLQYTSTNPRRDIAEANIFRRYKDKPKVGICRGGQLGNVLSGGTMWQDVDNHNVRHFIRTIDNRHIPVTSMHHQMMIPGIKGEVLATANQSTFFERDGETVNLQENERHWSDVEVVFYPETQILCFQPHPEVDGYQGRAYFFELLAKKFDFQFRPNPSADIDERPPG